MATVDRSMLYNDHDVIRQPEHAGIGRRLWALINPEEGWWSFILLSVMMISVVLTVEGAKWVREMPGLTGMAVGSVLIGYLLAKLRVPAILLHPVAVIIGALVVSLQIMGIASGELTEERIIDSVVRVITFSQVLSTGGINTDGLPFVLQILVLTWLVGYLAAWFLYRSHNVWLALLPPSISLLVNLTYLPGRFNFNFITFVACALLLIMAMHRAEQRRHWRAAQVPDEEVSTAGSGGTLLAVTGGILLLAFWLPLAQQSIQFTVLWEQATAPWRTIEREFDRLFASVSSGRVSALHNFGRSLPFKGAVNFGDNLPLASRLGLSRDIVMYVKAEQGGYWRAESYVTYSGQGWVTNERQSRSLARDTVPGAVEEYRDRKPFTQTVKVNLPLDVLFSRGAPVYGNVATSGDFNRPLSFTLSLSEPTRNTSLSPDLQDLGRNLSQTLRRPGRLASQFEIQRLLPPDLRVDRSVLKGIELDALELNRTEAFPPDYTSLRPNSALNRGQKYTVVSAVSSASVESLRTAGANYPGWARDHYLQLPATLPQRVKDLALEWTKTAGNTFDRALALETKIREFPYSTNIPPPPRDMDGVDYFLFDLKRGYADYNASAMAVMLRSIGIPARVSVGYVTGEYDSDKEQYTVREAHAHAWVEAFIPSYGWIEFNPTPNWPTPPRIYETNSDVTPEDDFFASDEPLPPSEDMPETDGALSDSGSSVAMEAVRLLSTLASIAVVLALLWFALRALWQRGLGGLNLASQTYEKMCRLALLARLGPRNQQTPLEYARNLAAAVPSAGNDVQRIANGYVRERYGQNRLLPAEQSRLDESWRGLRWRLVQQVIASLRRRLPNQR